VFPRNFFLKMAFQYILLVIICGFCWTLDSLKPLCEFQGKKIRLEIEFKLTILNVKLWGIDFDIRQSDVHLNVVLSLFQFKIRHYHFLLNFILNKWYIINYKEWFLYKELFLTFIYTFLGIVLWVFWEIEKILIWINIIFSGWS